MYDVVVVGAGIMGAATARALTQSGQRTLLLEQFDVGHERGSSHGSSRIFRLSYPDPAYVVMAKAALELWKQLEHEAHTELLVTLGGLDKGEQIAANASALRQAGVPFEFLDQGELARRFSTISVPEGEYLFQPDAGIVRADRAVQTFVERAVARGCELRERTKVASLRLEGDHVTVETSAGNFEAQTAVVTAGAWAKALLAGAGIELPTRPTRETVAYFALDGPPPPSFVEWGTPSIYSLYSPEHGLKVGEHIAGPTTDPDDAGVVDQSSIERVARWVKDRFPSAEPVPTFAETCLYTNTIDENFILERHGSIVVGSPCSGHGFKFAPAIGKRLAALATEGVT